MSENNYLELPYNPAMFEMDFAYLEKDQNAYIKNFISKRYSRNKEHIEIIPTLITHTFIRKQSNIYAEDVLYPEWEESFDERVDAISELEQYTNLNRQAVLWMYQDTSGTWNYQAYHARDFIYLGTKKDNESIIIRTGQELVTISDMSSEIWYIFKLWRDGKIYKCMAKSWEEMPKAVQGVATTDSNTIWTEEGIYDIFPFTNTNTKIVMPRLSYLPNLENIKCGGLGWGEIAAQRSFLSLLYGVTGLNGGEWQQLNEAIGLFKNPNLPMGDQGNNPSLNTLSLGDAKTQKEWIDIIDNSLKNVAFSEGVDPSGWLTEIRAGQSAAAKELELGQIADVRNLRIRDWKRFEKRNQELMVKLKIVTAPSKVVYTDLSIRTTEEDKQNLIDKKNANVLNRYNNGTITNVEKVMLLEDLTKDEAKARIKDVEKERGNFEEKSEMERIFDTLDADEFKDFLDEQNKKRTYLEK